MSMFLKRYLSHHRIVKPLLFLLGFIFIALIFFSYDKTPRNEVHQFDITVQIENIELQTMLAQNSEERATGLSNHTALLENQAMLFVFDRTGFYPFWMKDMDFPIDIFWLNEGKEVVSIKEYAHPDDYPESYRPEGQAKYVIETVEGFAGDNNISLGSEFSW